MSEVLSIPPTYFELNTIKFPAYEMPEYTNFVGTSDQDEVDFSSNAIPIKAVSLEQDDLIIGSTFNDFIFGNQDEDVLFGNSGDDFLSGGDGEDRLFGNSGDDFLSGNAGDDRLRGGLGDDTLILSNGTDILNGNSGNDTFRINNTKGLDFIRDFNPTEDILSINSKVVSGIDNIKVVTVESYQEPLKGIIVYDKSTGILWLGDDPLVRLQGGLNLTTKDIIID